jgi:hypothetical protein
MLSCLPGGGCGGNSCRGNHCRPGPVPVRDPAQQAGPAEIMRLKYVNTPALVECWRSGPPSRFFSGRGFPGKPFASIIPVLP